MKANNSTSRMKIQIWMETITKQLNITNPILTTMSTTNNSTPTIKLLSNTKKYRVNIMLLNKYMHYQITIHQSQAKSITITTSIIMK